MENVESITHLTEGNERSETQDFPEQRVVVDQLQDQARGKQVKNREAHGRNPQFGGVWENQPTNEYLNEYSHSHKTNTFYANGSILFLVHAIAERAGHR